MKQDRGQEIDVEEVGRLVRALREDLENIPGDAPNVQRLKDEVQALQEVLDSPGRRQHSVRAGLHSIRERIEHAVDVAVAHGLKPGQYIAEIGRILGM